jgi:hypothetical protein
VTDKQQTQKRTETQTARQSETQSSQAESAGGGVTSRTTTKAATQSSGKKTTKKTVTTTAAETSSQQSETQTTTTSQQTDTLSGTEAVSETVSQTTTAVTEETVDEIYYETDINVYIYIGIGALVLTACIVLFVRGKRNIASYIFIIVIGGVLCGVVALLDIESRQEHFAAESSSVSESIGQVTMSVDCLTIVGMHDGISDDGYIIPVQTVDIKEGDTAYDLLDRMARENGILIDVKGSDDMKYVSGIAGIYEFDHGELSGWMYYVNGEAPSVNSSQYTLKDGDRVEWRYTKEIGRDID